MNILSIGTVLAMKAGAGDEPRRVYWVGDPGAECQLCHRALKSAFVDGRTRAPGSWANMCLLCHSVYGVGLGTGRGQLYEKQADGRWLKVEG